MAFPLRSKCLHFMATVNICSDFGAQENKVCHCFYSFPICHEVMKPDAIILVEFQASFFTLLFHFH